MCRRKWHDIRRHRTYMQSTNLGERCPQGDSSYATITWYRCEATPGDQCFISNILPGAEFTVTAPLCTNLCSVRGE